MMRKRPSEWILGGVAAICLSLGSMLYLTYAAFSDLEASRASARQAIDQMFAIRDLFTALQDAETGQRGYLLSQDPAYLAPYSDSLGRIGILRDRLAVLAGEDPLLRQRMQDLFAQIDVKLAELQDTIEIGKRDGFDAARGVIVGDSGKRAMDAIRSAIEEITERTETEVRAGRAALQDSIERSRFRALFAGALGLFVAAVGGAILRNSFLKLKRAEASLREQASLLQTTLDNTSEGVAAFDAAHGLIAWNPRFFAFAGYADDFPRFGRSIGEFLEVDRNRTEKLFDLDEADANLAGLDQLAKLKPRLRVGGRDLECAHRRTQTGGIVMTCADVTERMRAEQVARQAQKMEAIGQLTGGVAHDFNNLLQVIASNLDLMNRHVGDRDLVIRHLKYASSAAERGAKLTRQLLAFARRQPLEPVVVNLGRRVRAMSDLLHRTLGETIEIETIVDAGLWNTFADIAQVENAVLNLAVNARDAMPEGGKLTIELANAVLDEKYARLHEEVRPGQYVMLAVTDTGHGMPADVAARAFEPFFTTKPEGQGTGLGLSMVYGFVKQSSGHAKIYSEPGLGTTIRIYLPRSRRPEEIMSAPESAPARGRNERILLVEDDEDVRRAVAETTRGLGYLVLEAKDGEEALAMLRGGLKIDLLFTDVVMSGAVSGRALAHEAQKLLPGLAVLFTSGYTENAIIHHGRLDEGVHLLSKPYREPELSAKLRAVLDERRPNLPEDEVDGRVLSPPLQQNQALSILLVDDDALIRLSTAEMLRDLGHDVTEAGSAEEALGLLAAGGRIDCLVADITLPDMDGEALAAEALRRQHDLRVLFASGHAGRATALDGARPPHAFLAKPYDMEQLAEALSRLMR